MAQRPCRSGASEPAIRSLNTGSPSKRGMQVQTWVPLASISEATWQLPVIPRSRVAVLTAVRASGCRHVQQPGAQLVGSGEPEFRRGGDVVADPQADAAEAVHDFERVFIGGVVASEYRDAVTKRRPLHQLADRRALGQVARPDLDHALAHQHAELAAEAARDQLGDLEYLAATLRHAAIVQSDDAALVFQLLPMNSGDRLLQQRLGRLQLRGELPIDHDL